MVFSQVTRCYRLAAIVVTDSLAPNTPDIHELGLSTTKLATSDTLWENELDISNNSGCYKCCLDFFRLPGQILFEQLKKLYSMMCKRDINFQNNLQKYRTSAEW